MTKPDPPKATKPLPPPYDSPLVELPEVTARRSKTADQLDVGDGVSFVRVVTKIERTRVDDATVLVVTYDDGTVGRYAPDDGLPLL